MRLIHCADLHLDSKLNTNLTREQAKLRREELLQTFVRMVDYAETHAVRAILIAGDLFDRRCISRAASRLVEETIRSHAGILFFYLCGNHEQQGFADALTEIPENLKLFSDGQRTEANVAHTSLWKRYDMGSLSIYGLDADRMNGMSVYTSLRPDPNRWNLVLLHGQLAEYASTTAEESIPLSLLRNRGIDYLALGHIHQYQDGVLDARGIWCYPGCLEGRGFDECGRHGFVLLDLDEATGQLQRSFVPIAGRKLYELSVDITGCQNSMQILACVRETLDRWHAEETDTAGARDYLKIVLCGSVDLDCEKHLELLRGQFAQDYFEVRVYDETTLAVHAEDYARDASLKGEFVRLVQAESSCSEEERAEIIRCGIRALSGEDILV